MGKLAPECFKMFVDIACCCTSRDGNKRPEMGEVVLMLDRVLEMQQKVDADMVHLAPCGVFMYEEIALVTVNQFAAMKNPLCSLRAFFVFEKKSPQLNTRSELLEDLCRYFSLAEIKAATNNFNPELFIGRGTYGPVYKGTIDDGTIVAVKRCQSISLQGPGVRQLRNEVQLLCQLRHPNLISLIGICQERNEMILVYEYMSRGSFGYHLYGEGYAPLPWKQRLQICIGAARGLHYLHTGAKYAIYHGNIQSLNILVTKESSCKLLEFGLSELGSFSMSKVSKVRKKTTVTATSGYMAPEYVWDGELTEKSDVYSFGIILFEVLFGRPITGGSTPQRNQNSLLDCAKESVREGSIYDAIDPNLKGRIAPECLNKYLEIACGCVHFDPHERQAMGEVEVTLEHALELQDRADAEMKAINPSSECMYEEASISSPFRNFDFGFPSYSSSSSSGFPSRFWFSDSKNSSNNNDERTYAA